MDQWTLRQNHPRQSHQTALELILQIRTLFKGGTVVKSIQEALDIRSNTPHRHVAAVLGMMNQLELPQLIAPKNSRNRRLTLGMMHGCKICPDVSTVGH